jgi:DNA-nicking Smr family endonuclease
MSEGDPESFARLVGKVRRLTHDTVAPARPRPPAVPRWRAEARDAARAPLLATAPADGAADTESADVYHRPGVQQGVLRRLRRGQFAVEDELDLHGLTVREAGIRLAAFLEHARGRRLTCVRIIHGKGMSSPGRTPVLKPQVARWLRDHDAVLAFAPAPARAGGSGATCALLRRRQA